jgi:hypothetical protein
MPKHYQTVREMIEDRKHIPDRDFSHQVREAFKAALLNDEDARALIAIPNRILRAGFSVVPFKLMMLVKKYRHDDSFLEKLYVGLGEGQVLSQMKKHLKELQKEDKGGEYGVPDVKEQHVKAELDMRTHFMGRYNRDVYKKQGAGEAGFFLKAKGVEHPVVDRYTRDFTVPLVSAGSGNREHILLDTESQDLAGYYDDFIRRLKPYFSIDDILRALAEFTKKVFASTNVSTLETVNETVPLSVFMKKRCGVCRHHTLFNSYVLSRLTKDEGLPDAIKKTLSRVEIIHHRQNITGGAHTWNIVKFKDGRVYNVDSLWHGGVFLLRRQSPDSQDYFYSTHGIGELMEKNYHCFSKRQDMPELFKVQALSPDEITQREVLEAICQGIENGDIGYNTLWATIFDVTTMRSGSTQLLSKDIAAVYKVATAALKGERSIKGVYESIKDKIKGNEALLFKEIQSLEDYVDEQFEALSSAKPEGYRKK